MIYADNAATTRISDRVFEEMLPFLCEEYGNASSQCSLGVKAKRAIEQARKQIASVIGSAPSEIIFTSGGSEANSWVLRSVTEAFYGEDVHIITSAIEHSSILKVCNLLEQNGTDVTYVPVNASGQVSVDAIEDAIEQSTKLVTIMFANNEIGTIQPIAEIGQLLKEKDILFHTDAVQAIGHISVDVEDLKVDFLTASAHKFNGAKGTGFLYKRNGLTLSPLVLGGGQESGFRAGTECVAGIVSAGFAIEESNNLLVNEMDRLNEMTREMVDQIKEKIPSARINGDSMHRLPGIINVGFEGMSGEAFMHMLDIREICVSTSSACDSEKNIPSHVLLALGQTESQAKSAIRISLGRYNTKSDADAIVSAICDVYLKIKESQ